MSSLQIVAEMGTWPMRDKSVGPASGEERNGDTFAVRVDVTREQVHELLSRGGIDYGDHANFTERGRGRGQLVLFLSQGQIDALRGEGYDVEIVSNQSARGRERLAEVGQGDRFEGGRIAPRGIGHKVGRQSPHLPARSDEETGA